MWAELLRDATGTARGIEGILVATAADTPEAIRPTVVRFARRLAYEPIEQALPDLAAELDHEVGDLVVTALEIAAAAGGRQIRSVLDDLARAAREQAAALRRQEVARERPRSEMRQVAVIAVGTVVGAEPGGRRVPRPLPQRSRASSCWSSSPRSGASGFYGHGPPGTPRPGRAVPRHLGRTAGEPAMTAALLAGLVCGLGIWLVAAGLWPRPEPLTDGAGPLRRARAHRAQPAAGRWDRRLGRSRARPRPGRSPGRRSAAAGRPAGRGPRPGGPRRRDGRVRAVRPGARPVVRAGDLAGRRPVPAGGRRRAQPGRRARRRRAAVAVAARPGRGPPGRVLPRAGRLLPRVRHVPRRRTRRRTGHDDRRRGRGRLGVHRDPRRAPRRPRPQGHPLGRPRPPRRPTSPSTTCASSPPPSRSAAPTAPRSATPSSPRPPPSANASPPPPSSAPSAPPPRWASPPSRSPPGSSSSSATRPSPSCSTASTYDPTPPATPEKGDDAHDHHPLLPGPRRPCCRPRGPTTAASSTAASPGPGSCWSPPSPSAASCWPPCRGAAGRFNFGF